MNGPNNPYSTTSLTNSPQLTMDVSTQIAKNREDEQQTKAPQTLPFTLDAANQVLGDMYMTLLQFKTMIQQTETEPKINKQALQNLVSCIDGIGQEILITIPENLDKLKL